MMLKLYPSLRKSTKILLATAAIAALLYNTLDIEDKLYNAWLRYSISEEDRKSSLWLTDYTVDIEASPIKGVARNASGLTWNPDTKTLFMVINRRNEIVELSTDGEVLRTISLEGFNDVEAITWIDGKRFAIVDERSATVALLDLYDDSDTIQRSDTITLTAPLNSGKNKGFEGIAYNPLDNALYVVKERDPMELFRITGLTGKNSMKNLTIEITDQLGDVSKRFFSDKSGLHFDSSTGHMLVLSDESQLLKEIDTSGKIVSFLELAAGWHGLKNDVPQPEGITSDSQGNIYIISEPNLFYRFSKPTQIN